MGEHLACPHCEKRIGRISQGKVKIPTRILVLHKSGALELNCPACKRPVLLPARLDANIQLRKAILTIRKT